MSALRQFEIDAIRLMAMGVLSEDQLAALSRIEEVSGYRYTGCGYFLTVKHVCLPTQRVTLHEPPVMGRAGDVEAGFVAYLQNGELELECHTWGAVDVPPDFRDRVIEILTPPPNYIDLSHPT